MDADERAALEADAPPEDRTRYVEGRSGLSGLAALYLEAVRLLEANRRLRHSFTRWLVAGLLVTEGLSVGAGGLVSTRVALLCGAGAFVWWLIVGLVLCGGAPLLVTPDDRRVDTVGWPNGLTALRAWSCLPLILFAALPLGENRSLLLWCAIGAPAGLLDLVDGWIARRFGPITELGAALDPAGDAVFFAMAAVGNVLVGIIPVWLMALMLLRYLGPLLATPLVFLTRRRPQLVHTEWGRRNTLLTGVLLFTCMWLRIFHGPVGLVAVAAGVPSLGVTTLLHFVALGQRVRLAPLVRPRLRERLGR